MFPSHDLALRIEFTRHVFGTLTYSRDLPVDERWSGISKDFNRYLQKIRRLHNTKLDYFRVVEKHRDGFPHIHVLLQWENASIRVDNSRYFDKSLYQKWRLLWQHGHSDYQKPRRASLGTLTYILKYLIKNQTQRTIWKRDS